MGMEREMLRLNQRLMLMLFTAPMDMVLDTLPTLDLSMEDTPPTPDQLSPAMLDQLFHPLDTLPTLDQFMEDTQATMEREMLRLNQRLMLMLFTAPMDMALDTLPTLDQFMEDTQATMARERLRLNQMLMLFTAPMDMVLDLSMGDTPPTPDLLSPAMPDQLFPPLDTLPTLDQSTEDTPEVSMDSTKPAFYQKENQRH